MGCTPRGAMNPTSMLPSAPRGASANRLDVERYGQTIRTGQKWIYMAGVRFDVNINNGHFPHTQITGCRMPRCKWLHNLIIHKPAMRKITLD